MKKIIFAIAFVAGAFTLQAQRIEPGKWQGVIEYEQEEVPFDFVVLMEGEVVVISIENGQENIRVDNITIAGDSITIPLKPFDAWIKAKVGKHYLEGYWKKGYRSKPQPFNAHYGKPRFEQKNKKGLKDFIGKWQLEVRPPTGKPYPAVGLFAVKGSTVHATFLTQVGDLRFFQGVVRNDSLLISSFDGAHAFLFRGKLKSGELTGTLVMDNKYAESVSGQKNNDAEIPLPYKEISDQQQPYFDILAAGDPDVNVDESAYYGKVLVLQLFGTWCPNSMDQTRFLREWHTTKPEEVEILAVTYEPNFSTAYGNQRITDYKKSMDLSYQVSLGGELSKGQAALALPYTDKINAFPTLILIDKFGFIRYEFSYFNGPATGPYHEAYVEKFNECIQKLIKE